MLHTGPNATASNVNITPFMSSNLTSSEGHIVARSYNPGYVILSFLISYVGAWIAMELIHMRTSWKGRYNWFILVAASISMGGVATWCMHFIGLRAINLGGGRFETQIAYSPGFTALSFFVPVFVLMIAFWTAGPNEEVNMIRVCLGGTLAGLGFCVTNYLGQAGISNYVCLYVVGLVIASAIVSVLASITALGLLFHFRSGWRIYWWKRACSAGIFAVGISAANWFSICGTEYRLKNVDKSLTSDRTTTITVIVIITLSVCGCLTLVGLSVLAQTEKAQIANRAQQVVLAAAVFDRDDRILVTPNGLLPNRKVTQQFLERSFNDVFSASHPVFLWIFRTTYYWQGIYNLVAPMRKHIEGAGLAHGHLRSTSQANLLTEDGEPVEEYAIIFRELFCIAAWDLAARLNRDLTEMGVLYEEITNTGRKPANTKRKQSLATLATRGKQAQIDAERATVAPGGEVLGKGQLLFLVSRVDRAGADNLVAAGYRFAQREVILPFLASSLQIGHHDISRRLDLMIDYIGDSHILDPGVHICCFAIRASIGLGFDVLARRDAKNLLPTMQVPLEKLEDSHLDYLKTMPLQSVAQTMKVFNKASKPANKDEKLRAFAKVMLTTLEALKDEIDDPFFNDAQLIVTPIEAPCRGAAEDSTTSTALLITYKIIVPIHARAPGKKLQFVPLSLFRTQQRVYPNSPDHAIFARESHRLFSKILDLSEIDADTAGVIPSSKSKFSFRERFGPKRSTRSRTGETMDESETGTEGGSHLMPGKFRGKARSTKRREDASSEQGLMVDQENGPGPSNTSGNDGIPMKEIQKPKGPVKEEEEEKNYLDEILAITIKTKEGARI